MQSQNTSVETVKQALRGLLLSQATNDQLAKVMLLIYALTGLRAQHYPTPMEDKILFSFIREEYSNKTLDELLLAFKLAIKGELDLEDVKVYDQFTCEYMARVMTAYRKWLKKVNAEVTPPAVKLKSIVPIVTMEEKLSDIAEWEAKTDIRIEFIPPYIFDYLRDVGKISISDEARNRYMAKARDQIKTDLYNEWQGNIGRKMIGADLIYKKFMIMYSEKRWSAEYLSQFRNLAKKIIVFEYLTNRNSNASK